MPARKAPKTVQVPTSEEYAPVLSISRNKHLRHISAYHGPWLRLDAEFLSDLLKVNATAKRPVPIHQGTLDDIYAIKKLVDEAVGLSIRATNQQSVTGRGNISKERQLRMFQLAVSKLVKAYALNEIAASVSTMQSASALEEVASKVLKKDSEDLDALYVHFFHERIPSRQLAESTSLDTLNLLIRSRPLDAHLLRTRATVLTFKEEHLACIKDLTSALSLLSYHKAHNGGGSLESQLLFMRGEAYLTLSVNSVQASLEPGNEDLRKRVRQYARRSIKDFLKFCSLFEYSSNLGSGTIYPLSALFDATAIRAPTLTISSKDSPRPTPSEISRRVTEAKAKRRMEAYASSGGQAPSEISKILASAQEDTNRPALTYHPLLPDCLHGLLLSHVLACTPSPELKRHAERVLHVSKTCDGFPVFLSSRSSSRSDWTDLLRRRGGELIGLRDWKTGGPGGQVGTGGGGDGEGTGGNGGTGGGTGGPKEYPVSERAGIIADWVTAVYLAHDRDRDRDLNHEPHLQRDPDCERDRDRDRNISQDREQEDSEERVSPLPASTPPTPPDLDDAITPKSTHDVTSDATLSHLSITH